MNKKTERLGLYLTPKLKNDLRDMCDETGYTLNNLGFLALTNLVANYKKNGMAIFPELLKMKKRSE